MGSLGQRFPLSPMRPYGMLAAGTWNPQMREMPKSDFRDKRDGVRFRQEIPTAVVSCHLAAHSSEDGCQCEELPGHFWVRKLPDDLGMASETP